MLVGITKILLLKHANEEDVDVQFKSEIKL